MHKPHCWHPDTEELYGREMELTEAIRRAEWFLDSLQESLAQAQNNLDELYAKREETT
jgi:hypothetical protein